MFVFFDCQWEICQAAQAAMFHAFEKVQMDLVRQSLQDPRVFGVPVFSLRIWKGIPTGHPISTGGPSLQRPMSLPFFPLKKPSSKHFQSISANIRRTFHCRFVAVQQCAFCSILIMTAFGWPTWEIPRLLCWCQARGKSDGLQMREPGNPLIVIV